MKIVSDQITVEFTPEQILLALRNVPELKELVKGRSVVLQPVIIEDPAYDGMYTGPQVLKSIKLVLSKS